MATPLDQTSPYQSQYPELKIPSEGWQSSIPAHLLESASEADRWLMTEMSKNTQATTFACQGAVDLSNRLRELNGKTYRNEQSAQESKVSIDLLKAQVEVLGLQMKQVIPVATTYSTIRSAASNKIVWLILGINVLFLLGYNRSILPAIAKYLFGS